MYELIDFKGRHNINIPREVGTHYKKFGILLLLDPMGNDVNNIAYKNKGYLKPINTDILQKWLEGNGEPPT